MMKIFMRVNVIKFQPDICNHRYSNLFRNESNKSILYKRETLLPTYNKTYQGLLCIKGMYKDFLNGFFSFTRCV